MSQLEEEKKEVQRLENEKREWLSRGVHAEFEKKDKVHTCIGYFKVHFSFYSKIMFGKIQFCLAHSVELHVHSFEDRPAHDIQVTGHF